MTPPHATRTRRLAALAMAGTLTFGLAACGSGSSSSASGAGGAVGMSAPAAAPDKAGAPADAATTSRAGSSVDTVSAAAPMLVRRADTALVVKDVMAAVATVRGIATTAGGSVVNESIQSTQGNVTKATYGTMTIQVPADRLDDVLTRLDTVGDVASRDTSSEDVKAQYVDVEARVASMQTSVDRMRTLLSQATAVQDILQIESELARRQADLDALQAQLKSLKDQVAMSPISIRLTTDRVDLGADGGGFLGGLKAGWSAFLSSIRFLLTALGAVLPFAVFLALIVAPFVLWLRKRNRIHRPGGPGGPSAGAMVPAQPYPPTQPVGASAPAPRGVPEGAVVSTTVVGGAPDSAPPTAAAGEPPA